MSWLSDNSLTFFQRFCVNVLKCGPIPKHVAFIMDGNRRYATKTKVKKAQGHSRGFEKLSQTLHWCREFGITEVTVYAFSIENFKRSPEEVETLMKLAEEKFEKLLQEKERIMQEGVCVRVIGNLTLLSQKLRKLVAEAVFMTRDNTNAFLNIAFAYTSRDEIANTMKTIAEGVEDKLIEINDITEELFSKCLYTNQSPDPNILLRTSGEVRLSDFLLWQVSGSDIYFTEVLWPEFSIWHLMACVFKYQRNYYSLRMYEDFAKKESQKVERNERAENFLRIVQEQRLEKIRSYLAST